MVLVFPPTYMPHFLILFSFVLFPSTHYIQWPNNNYIFIACLQLWNIQVKFNNYSMCYNKVYTLTEVHSLAMAGSPSGLTGMRK